MATDNNNTGSTGKTIIITGANGNLGSASVKKFLDEGYKVVAVASKNEQLQFALGNPYFEMHAVDLVNETATAVFVEETISRHVKVDAALMLVGGFAMGTAATTTGADIHTQHALNFETAYFVARPLLQHMQQQGYGRLVFIGARPAIDASQGKDMVAYALSKSLLFTLAGFINEENKGSNIVASVVVPSTIDTEANSKSMPDADTNAWVKPEVIAGILAFICSEKASAIREPVYKVYNNA